MSEKQWNSVEELLKEAEKRLLAIPDNPRKNVLDNGHTGYEEVRDWFFEERKKLLARTGKDTATLDNQSGLQ